MTGFRYRPGIGVPYERQGLIYFVSRTYREQPPRTKGKIERLCRAAAGEHWRALFCYVTTEMGTVEVCQKYHVGEATLCRAMRRYYTLFEREQF